MVGTDRRQRRTSRTCPASPSLPVGISECAVHAVTHAKFRVAEFHRPPAYRHAPGATGHWSAIVISAPGAQKRGRGPMFWRTESQRRTNGGDITEPRRE